ncbi:MAG: OmpA family protein [Gammaproteobacteria bacterium]|nr:OmpA family protein [Gammaproteobacteria bacterium]MCP5202269.1 OmpA family protein [Gammaproteobacteria bacterium]
MRRFFHTELLDTDADEGVHAERWLLSYADFITLLFALFVVMYSVSSLNDGKFRVLSAALVEVFADPDVVERLERAPRKPAAPPATPAVLGGAEEWAELPFEVSARELAEVLRALLARREEAVGVAVRESTDWTELELPAAFAFDGDGQRLADAAGPLLDDVAALARAAGVPVRVEAYTDDVPVTPAQPSAWERTAAQAGAVAARLVAAGVDADQVSATGLGDRHPLASNASAAGRAANRRVVVAVARHGQVPSVAASLAAAAAREALPPNTYSRVTELPGPEGITL